MTTTTEEQVGETAEAPKVPTLANAEWVTITHQATRDDQLLPDFPVKVLRRSNADGYRIELPPGYGRHDSVRHEDDGTASMSVPARYLESAAGPKTDVDIPSDIAAMSREELVAAYAEYKFRTERTIKHVHRHAQIQGMCGTFDRIMERCGWPARPRRYEVVLQADRTSTMDSKTFISKFVGRIGSRKIEGLGDGISVTEPVQAVIIKELTGTPTKNTNVYEVFDRAEVERQFSSANGTLDGVDLESVRVHTVY